MIIQKSSHHQSLIVLFKIFILFCCNIHVRNSINYALADTSSLRGFRPASVHNSSSYLSDKENFQLSSNITPYHHSNKLITQANTASTFTANTQISLAQQGNVAYQLWYIDRLNMDCSGLGLSTFLLQNSGNNWWFNYVCVTPGFATPTTSYSIQAVVQGGSVPVCNIKFFQYLSSIADCR